MAKVASLGFAGLSFPSFRHNVPGHHGHDDDDEAESV